MKLLAIAALLAVPTPLFLWLAYLAAVQHDAARGAVAAFWVVLTLLALIAGVTWALAIVGAVGAHVKKKKGAA